MESRWYELHGNWKIKRTIRKSYIIKTYYPKKRIMLKRISEIPLYMNKSVSGGQPDERNANKKQHYWQLSTELSIVLINDMTSACADFLCQAKNSARSAVCHAIPPPSIPAQRDIHSRQTRTCHRLGCKHTGIHIHTSLKIMQDLFSTLHQGITSFKHRTD